jgi:hypothetical protein
LFHLATLLSSFLNPAVSSVTATPWQQADDDNASWSRHGRGNICQPDYTGHLQCLSSNNNLATISTCPPARLPKSRWCFTLISNVYINHASLNKDLANLRKTFTRIPIAAVVAKGHKD